MNKPIYPTVILGVLLTPALVYSQTRAWVARYDGPGELSEDVATAIAISADGYVHVTGYSGRNPNDDIATVKYAPNGNELWVARYDGPAGRLDYGQAIAVDDDGNVYVTGFSEGQGTRRDLTTLKYDADGRQVWLNRYDGPASGDDVAVAIALDPDGNPVVTGFLDGAEQGGVAFGTIKYDFDGSRLWVARYDGPDHAGDEAVSVGLDGAGNIYVTGRSSASNGQDTDFATVKYDPDGRELWVRRYNGPRNDTDIPAGLAVSPAGNIYVTGQSFGLQTHDIATIRYDSSGNIRWLARFEDAMPTAMAVDDDDNVYLAAGDSLVLKYDPPGNLVWDTRFGNPGGATSAIGVDASQNVYVTGWTANHRQYLTAKLDPAGELVWVQKFPEQGQDGGGQAWGLSLDADANVYVTGYRQGNETHYDFVTVKYLRHGGCVGSERLAADCFLRCRDGRLHVSARARTELVRGTRLTFTIDGADPIITTTNRRGRAKAKWEDVEAGPHDVGIVECGLSKQTDCCW